MDKTKHAYDVTVSSGSENFWFDQMFASNEAEYQATTAGNCYGTAGTYGTFGGTAGTLGTYGCAGS